jgi:hypothetical protein
VVTPHERAKRWNAHAKEAPAHGQDGEYQVVDALLLVAEGEFARLKAMVPQLQEIAKQTPRLAPQVEVANIHLLASEGAVHVAQLRMLALREATGERALELLSEPNGPATGPAHDLFTNATYR